MEASKHEEIIKNENLFRALVCAPLAILFSLLATNSVMSSGLIIFQVLFILLALYFSYITLSHAALYTNERYEGKTEPQFKNKNLSKTIKFSPFAILFSFIAQYSLMSPDHLFFKIVFLLLAITFVLCALSYAAFYTNDYFAEQAEH